MEDYKKQFIDFLLQTGALKVGGDFMLKSGRLSPYFVNIGDFNDGTSTSQLGAAYAHAIKHAAVEFDVIYGIPEKGVGLAIATSIELAKLGMNKPWFFTRKMPKEHGESSQTEKIKSMIVGKPPQQDQRIVQVDDVFSAGDAKQEARKTLMQLGNFHLPLLVIAVDRQEVGIDGMSAIENYERQMLTKVSAIVSATEICKYLESLPETDKTAVERMARYLQVYGTPAARDAIGNCLEQRIVNFDRSIIPSADVPTIEQFEELVKQTTGVEGIGGYKVGFELALTYGLPKIVEVARKHTIKPVIYDHQKAGTDIPDTGKNFAQVCKKAGVDAVIFFPQAGPETERAWIYHALDQSLKVIIGGRMTHAAYAVSEGGFITDEGVLEIYKIAARAGVTDFVVPGNKPDVVKNIKEIIQAEGIDPVFYAPGFVAQGGKITEAAKVAGKCWHAIIGRGIYQTDDVKKAAEEYSSQIKD